MMRHAGQSVAIVLLLLGFSFTSFGQRKQPFDSVNFGGISFRNVGPAFMSGRIADVAVDPKDESHYYVGAASGGVWETKNAGVSFKPIFDKQKVYSIGCITIDPQDHNVVWVGTGENVGGRHISFGDGVYRSNDGGKSWKNIGLKHSEHISKIVVHPKNSNIVWVAAQGPLWNSGGERGVYMTKDGGKKWKRVLGDNEWTGATDLVIDPRNPKVLYAATWQRHRTVAAYMGGGPKSGIHKSTDGGETWLKLTSGLPSGPMGKIGLGISPIDPDILYAAIELNQRKGGVYRSATAGATWEKRSDAVAGGTGPHYYQELWVSPHQLDHIYLANNYLLGSIDGGKSFSRVSKQNKHVDNHVMVFRLSDPDYLMVGTDGGLYESFDAAQNWRHFGNLPLTQFYKLAIDDAEPFYTIYGGTQDNNTQGGPSRTHDRGGIDEGAWQVILGGDGHQPATEPGNPSIVYAQSQQGEFRRVDIQTGEIVDVQPQPLTSDQHERYNWDAPIFVCPHDPKQVYVASQRLWRSTDRGEQWSAISPDLTRNEERFDLPIMGRKQSIDNAWDVYAMSNYNTITSIAESPVQRDLLYVGTDDGLISVSLNGGKNWRRMETRQLPGAPQKAYVNDIKADQFDENVVYVCLDHHKSGDFSPYIYVSRNKGKTWKRITDGIPENYYVWRVVQDHIQPNLLFAATEFGVFVTLDGGVRWKQLKGGLPTVSFRDLAIHRKADDLVLASFGRGFYVLDDIQFFRELSERALSADVALFGLRDAALFIPRSSQKSGTGSQGSQHFVGQNPSYGAQFTYWVKDGYKSASQLRKEEEKECNKQGQDIDFPGWDVLENEGNEDKVEYWLVIRDAEGYVVSRQKVSSSKGFHRVEWNLRYNDQRAVGLGAKANKNQPRGFYAPEGTYTGQLERAFKGERKALTKEVEFRVKPLYTPSIPPVNDSITRDHIRRYYAAVSERDRMNAKRTYLRKKVQALEVAMLRAKGDISDASVVHREAVQSLEELDRRLNGYKIKNQVGEKNDINLNQRIALSARTMRNNLHGPTVTQQEHLKLAEEELLKVDAELTVLAVEVSVLEVLLRSAEAPPVIEP